MAHSSFESRRSALQLTAGLGLYAALARPSRAATPDLTREEFAGRAWSENLSQADATLRYLAYYAHQLRRPYAPPRLAALPDQAVVKAFDDLLLIVFHTADQDVARHLLQVHEVLLQRGLAMPAQLQRSYDACYSSRLFAPAAQLAQRFPGQLEVSPLIHVAADAGIGVPTLIRLVSGRRELYATRYVMPLRPTVIMIGDPGCHFSRAATDALTRDAALMRRFDGTLQLLAPHALRLRFDDYAEWNAQHPALPMAIAYHWRGWPMLDVRSTPVFYFFNDGKVRHVAAGWRDDTAKDGLIAGLAAIGL
ncbi:hypothetical protein Jab_1c22070 [Janthinobacterium sp. HH01]|uniref:hypothetical protein n=1 Tax=Janthinobacterium sp. HH01 TaxID=1198452 RepID=UPI0002AEBD19|nr:hypothetical protein [Janthinobacterium sp. HH01]ELX13571.1 hypothetical protein Jab_1c22070 [Janthinobacterium sp. HH01]